MKELTKKQLIVYQFIHDFVQKHNYPPTVREIAGNFGLSVKAAHDHILALKRKNVIKTSDNRQRTMEVVDRQEVVEDGFVEIPVLGEVAAGRRILTEENFDGNVKMHSSLLKKNKTYYALKVKGDSMIGIGVLDGDTVIVEKRETAKNGEVVVVEVDEGRALKRFFQQTNRIKLQSENPKYPPIYTTDVRILGRLAGVYRVY